MSKETNITLLIYKNLMALWFPFYHFEKKTKKGLSPLKSVHFEPLNSVLNLGKNFQNSPLLVGSSDSGRVGAFKATRPITAMSIVPSKNNAVALGMRPSIVGETSMYRK